MRSLFLLVFFVTGVATAWAQGTNSGSASLPRFEFYAGYLSLGHQGPPTFYNFTGFNALNREGSPAGFDAGVVWSLNRLVAIRGNVSGSYNAHSGTFAVPCNQSTCEQTTSLGPHVYEFLGGPEFRFRTGSRVMPFTYAVVGAVYSTARFATSGPVATFSQDTSATGFSLAGGGGLAFRITNRLRTRFSVDYNPAFFGHLDTGERQTVQYIRFGAGIVVH
jgi:hypothetical protein